MPLAELGVIESAGNDDLKQAAANYLEVSAKRLRDYVVDRHEGGDAPEAAYDGLEAACAKLKWRPHSYRLAVLVGDAPPHGTGCGGDGFRNGCPCGLTVEQVTARLEENGITLYALGLTAAVRTSFAPLATWTGGTYFEAAQTQKAIDALQELLKNEFAGIDLDRQVLELCRCDLEWTVDGMSETLASGRQRVAASLSKSHQDAHAGPLQFTQKHAFHDSFC